LLTIENIENATKSFKIGSFLKFLENIEKITRFGVDTALSQKI
jgi:hypothetical protein